MSKITADIAHAATIEGLTAAGAFVMGRNMFGLGRGEWDLDWNGQSSQPKQIDR